MRITGKVPEELKFAAEFFGQQLIKDGRIRRHINVEIEIDPTLDGFAGICVADEDRFKPKYFTIQLNPTAGVHTIQCLAHEMVHVKQYVTGELYDHMNGHVVWKGESFIGQVSYGGDIEDAPPWEEEAYRLESGLFEEYLALEVM